jgi:hypothetical protein
MKNSESISSISSASSGDSSSGVSSSGSSSFSSKRGFQIFSSPGSVSSSETVIYVDENGGRFIFAAELNLPPESEKFLKTDGLDFSQLNPDLIEQVEQIEHFDNFSNFQTYTLSSGSIIFRNSYSQLPDQVYFLGPSSLILSQNDGAVSVFPSSIHFSENESGSLLLSLSGKIFKSNSSPVFGNRTLLSFEQTRKAEGIYFATAVAIQYLPAIEKSNSSEIKSGIETNIKNKTQNRDEAIEKSLFDFHKLIESEYSDLESFYDSETFSLLIYSEKPFEIHFLVEEFNIEFESV